jgi:beta-N-acetylhexosaminidase
MIYLSNPAKLFILGFHGLAPDRDFIKLIERNPPAGFLLLGENYDNIEQLRRLVSDLKNVAGGHALFLIDQEPGRVQRFKNGFPLSKLPQDYLKPDGTSAFRKWCRQTAEIMAELGININLAPVLDLCVFDRNYPVLNGRSFGDNPLVVSEYGVTLIEEFREFGILTCAKHFPGLGAGKLDPHEALAISDETIERFLNFHWLPFKAANDAKVDFFMTTHLLARKLDPEKSATYSKTIVNHIRHTIGFSGPIISDDLYMEGSGLKRDIENAVLDCIASGHTLLIISRDSAVQSMAIEAIRNRCQNDDIFSTIVSENEKQIDTIAR